MEATLVELPQKMDVGNEILLAIKKQNDEGADAENDYRLLQILPRESQEFKFIMDDMLEDRKRRREKRDIDEAELASVDDRGKRMRLGVRSGSGAIVVDEDSEYFCSSSCNRMY